MPALNRRSLLRAAGGALLTTALPRPGFAADGHAYRLTAAPGNAELTGGGRQTAVWSYNDSVPGPEIRIAQGSRLTALVENRLKEQTTVHWHGIRLPNAMDGVPHLTQPPIESGGTFTYAFDVPDAGTYWYHPHSRSFEQVARGLYGALIVEERAPVEVDRDVTWVLGDWRLKKDAAISDDFGDFMDMTHNGRVGNTVTINGRIPDRVPVRAGERWRLRLINAATARIFGLEFQGHAPQVIALDGQPVAPHAPENGQVILGPATRADLILDMTGQPGGSFAVMDRFYQGLEYKLLDLTYGADPPIRDKPSAAPIALAPNDLPELDIAKAERHDMVLGGGMMGGMAGVMMNGRMTDMKTMMQAGMAWAINGVAAGEDEHAMPPMLTLDRGRSCILDIRNDTAWFHPMHLHGHAFRVITRNGAPTRFSEWRDTVLVAPKERVEIAFVADNPGDWMIHCHVLAHQAGGMMGVIRVA